MATSTSAPTFISGEKTVTAAGTAEALASTQRVKSCAVVAKLGNTGKVYLGGSDVASTTNDGLDPGDVVNLPAINWLDLAHVYIDVDTTGEGVDFYAVKA
tara:strand:+ start:333 stop:632 length:300 start_codon:yes stop_codon:yes gene_type:complete